VSLLRDDDPRGGPHEHVLVLTHETDDPTARRGAVHEHQLVLAADAGTATQHCRRRDST
jgi:hypothetical protein